MLNLVKKDHFLKNSKSMNVFNDIAVGAVTIQTLQQNITLIYDLFSKIPTMPKEINTKLQNFIKEMSNYLLLYLEQGFLKKNHIYSSLHNFESGYKLLEDSFWMLLKDPSYSHHFEGEPIKSICEGIIGNYSSIHLLMKEKWWCPTSDQIDL
jgi:hypothetical protein